MLKNLLSNLFHEVGFFCFKSSRLLVNRGRIRLYMWWGRWLLAPPLPPPATRLLFNRWLHITPTCCLKKTKYPPRPKWLIVEDELDEKFLKGGRGPGGQKINKTNSKVQLTHLPTGIVVTCQYSRSQELNRKRAREILALKLEELQNPEGCRTAVIGAAKLAAKQAKARKSRKKYQELAETKPPKDEAAEAKVDPEAEFNQFLQQIHNR